MIAEFSKLPLLTQMAICIVFLGVALAGFFGYRVKSILRERHTEKWYSLGSPSLINNSIKNNWLMLKFLYGNEFAALNDQELHRYCRLQIACSIMVVGGLFMVHIITAYRR